MTSLLLGSIFCLQTRETQMADLGSNEMTANLVHHPVLGTRWVLTAFVRVHLHPGPWVWPSGGQCWLTQV